MPGCSSGSTISRHRLRNAARALRAGGLVAHPTEGVWGLACNPVDAAAVLHLLAVKQRDPAKGLILIADRPEVLAPFTDDAPEAWQRACAAWPGPSTWLLPAHPALPYWLTGAHDRIALRVTAHPVAAALCRAFGGALVSTSANISRRAAARHAWQVRARFGNHINVVLGGRLGDPGRPSTITDAVSGKVMRA